MILIPKPKIKTISEHALAFKAKHPDFILTYTLNDLCVKGWAKPTARSSLYRFQLKYKLNQRPAITIVEPVLEIHEDHEELPHIYSGDELCLYYPYYSEFTHRELLTETVIPWITLWLYYYEKWAVTGKWLGGGIH